jgi:DNA polymerase III sliding clamp (beta) subunit (PCNA family)
MIPQGEFHAILKVMAHSAGTDMTRYNLNAVLFEFLGDSVRLVSTDGHRITVAALDISAGTGNFLAPIDDVKEVLGIFKHKSDKRISFTVSGDALVVTNGKASLNVERLVAEYPDYRQVLPADDTVLAGTARFNLNYLAQMATACKSLMGETSGVDIITRGAKGVATLRPVLDRDLEIVRSLEVHVMSIGHDDAR